MSPLSYNRDSWYVLAKSGGVLTKLCRTLDYVVHFQKDLF